MELKSIMTDDFEHCFLCGKQAQQIHHVFNKYDKKRSEKYGLLVPLCAICHSNIHDRDEKQNKELKKLAQTLFEQEWGHDKWFDEFGRNYRD